MQFKRILGLVLVLSLAFVLTACGGASATPEATAAVDAGGGDATGVELSESASAADAMGGTVSVSYPAGWTAQEMAGAGTVALTGSEAGQAVSVTFLNSTMATALGDSPSAILGAQTSAFSGVSGATVSEVTEKQIGGNDAATITITVADVATYYYVVAAEGGYAFVYGAGVDAATVEAIAASVSYAGA